MNNKIPHDLALSVVIPVYNEEESVGDLAREVDAALNDLDRPWECLWVDDGSTDGTLDVLRALCKAPSSRHRWISLSPNAGQSAALAAGFAAARAPVIATLDGDGQNDPKDIPNLLARLDTGDFDMVNGVRASRQDSFTRKCSSRIGNGFRNWLTRDNVTDVGCSLRVFRREFVLELPVFKGMHRFLPTLARMKGCRVTELPVHHRPRLRGQAKYGIGNRLWVGLGDTLAVCWMARRLVWPRVGAVSDPVTSPEIQEIHD